MYNRSMRYLYLPMDSQSEWFGRWSISALRAQETVPPLNATPYGGSGG
jgi:hypothetical protein